MRTVLIRVSLLFAVAGLSAAVVLAAPGGVPGPPGGGEEETASNNLSFPVVFSDSAAPDGFAYASYDPAAWTFAGISNPAGECTPGNEVPVPQTTACYWDETTVWWLQQREANEWQAYYALEPVEITAIDWGDLLESRRKLTPSRIRTEVVFYYTPTTDAEPLWANIVDDWEADFLPGGKCETGECFAALEMSGAVPGTDQSINEIQGTNFGPGSGAYPGTRELIDPVGVRGYHATVYSDCARFLIQKLPSEGVVAWSSVEGRWLVDGDPGSMPALVELAAYEEGGYTAEINASGTMIYGYNWNAKTDNAGPGMYRITVVLDGDRCDGTLGTTIGDGTSVINTGEVTAGQLMTAAELASDEGGLTYVDVELKSSNGKGGGGKGGGGKGGGGGGGGH